VCSIRQQQSSITASFLSEL